MIRDEISARGEEITIDRLTKTGNELRTKFGPGILAERALLKLSPDGRAVVTSIRHGAELRALRKRGDFAMVFVDAPARVRYERSLRRARPGDCSTFEEFVAAEKFQLESQDPNSQQLLVCRDLADRVLDNAGDREEFVRKIEAFLSDLEAD
jgi:dephospho-CoA kinase